ncbi:MAG: sigma-70 family RNA polymerase sigma factor [Actinomycetales bacterium]|nr:sigma-70 family RNA polymerase sigma factor [Actinomycetales bacterium]
MTGRTDGGDALWSRARAGDGEAFGRVFDAHRERVYRHALRLVGTAHEAEDVTAVAFLELWRRRDHVRLVDGSVLPWLLVTAGNVARNQRRATRRYRRFLAALPRPGEAPDAAEPALAGALGMDPDLREALRTLPAPDLHLLTLVALEDCTIADAAAVLGIGEGAAKTRLHRIRTRLRGQLAGTLPAGPTSRAEP